MVSLLASHPASCGSQSRTLLPAASLHERRWSPGCSRQVALPGSRSREEPDRQARCSDCTEDRGAARSTTCRANLQHRSLRVGASIFRTYRNLPKLPCRSRSAVFAHPRGRKTRRPYRARPVPQMPSSETTHPAPWAQGSRGRVVLQTPRAWRLSQVK